MSMSSNEKNKTNSTQNFNQNEPLTEKEASSKKPKVLLTILILLILTIVGVFGYMVKVAMTEDAIDQSVAAEKMKEDNIRLTPETIDYSAVNYDEAVVESNSLLAKLASAEPVSILVIGDVFGTGAGASVGADWTELLAENLKNSFGSEVTVNNLSLGNANNAYSAYVTLMNEAAGNKDAAYDAVIVSLGYYDDPFNFSLQYEGILREIRRNYGSCEIIGLIESAAVTDPEGHSDETALYAKDIISHYGGIAANMGEAFAVTGQDYSTLTVDGVLPNEAGHKVYADWILKKIKEKMDGEAESDTASGAATASVEALDPDSDRYDHYYYIAAGDFLRADDLNYIIGIKALNALGVENVGMLGIDYEYVEGKNTVQIVLDRNIFAGLQNEYEGTAPERHIRIVNNNASVYEEMAVSFATKEQADAFHGIIMTGNLKLHQNEEKYDKLPMPPETTAPPETEPETEAPQEETEEETAKASEESKKKETTAADSKNKKSDEKTEETRKKESESKKSSGSSGRNNNPQPQATAAPAAVAETAAPETAQTVTETVVETAPTVPQAVEGAVISDPANSGNILQPETAYTVQPGQGIDIQQWNSVGPTVG